MKPIVIVLTGGPCAGKTTALETVRREIEHTGRPVAIVPEVATMLFPNGFALRKAQTESEEACYQWQLCEVQRILEQAQSMSLEVEGDRASKRGLLLCDRGIFDNKAYVKLTVWNRLPIHVQSTMERYDGIIHMASAANGAEEHYKQTEVRVESPKEALALDGKTWGAWTGHPHHIYVGNSDGFKTKIDRVVEVVQNMIKVAEGTNGR